MRISSTLFFQTGLNSINAQQSDLMHIYQQLGSGQRMVTPADDPLAAAQAINISQAQTMNARFAKNRDVANQNLGIEDNTLGSINVLMQNLKTELIYAGNGTLSDADRATLGNVLSNARENLLGLVNATDGSGQYLFSGAKGDTAAYQDVNGKIVYMGDAGQRKIQADQTRQIASSDVGSDIFDRAAPGTTSYLTSAGAANAGTGVISTPMIMDPNGTNIGKIFNVTFVAGPNPGEFTYTAIAKDPAGGTDSPHTGVYIPGTTASLDLGGGVQANFSGVPVPGDGFVVEPASSSDYAASKTVGGADAAISSPEVSDYSKVRSGDVYQIKFDTNDKYTVTISNPAFPGQDIVIGDQKFVPGRENTLQLPHGMQVKISGEPAINDTFVVKPSAVGSKTDLNIFDTLDGLIAALKTPLATDEQQAAFQNTLNTAMQRLDVNYNNVLTVRASVGARMNELDGLNANGAMRSLSYSGQLKQLEDLDYYSASTQLQLRTAALEAAALAFRKIQSTSLFNMNK